MSLDPHDLIPPPVHDRVDNYVQRWVAGTNGNLYVPLINKLPRYPVPVWPGPPPAAPFSLLLDIGCGWGRWMIAAARAGHLPVGIDIKLDALKAARRVLKAHNVHGYVVAADLTAFPFAETSSAVFSPTASSNTHTGDTQSAASAQFQAHHWNSTGSEADWLAWRHGGRIQSRMTSR